MLFVLLQRFLALDTAICLLCALLERFFQLDKVVSMFFFATEVPCIVYSNLFILRFATKLLQSNLTPIFLLFVCRDSTILEALLQRFVPCDIGFLLCCRGSTTEPISYLVIVWYSNQHSFLFVLLFCYRG